VRFAAEALVFDLTASNIFILDLWKKH